MPKSLVDSQQHFGRCGRQGEQSYAIMMVSPSTFKRKNAASKRTTTTAPSEAEPTDDRGDAVDDHDGASSDASSAELDLDAAGENEGPGPSQPAATYQKTVEFDLRRYLDVTRCRRDITNDVFKNPTSTCA